MKYINQYEGLTNQKLWDLGNIELIVSKLQENWKVKIPLPILCENKTFVFFIEKLEHWFIFKIQSLEQKDDVLEFQTIINKNLRFLIKQVFEKFSFETDYSIKSYLNENSELIMQTQDEVVIWEFITIFYNHIFKLNIKVVSLKSPLWHQENPYEQEINPGRDPMSYN